MIRWLPFAAYFIALALLCGLLAIALTGVALPHCRVDVARGLHFASLQGWCVWN